MIVRLERERLKDLPDDEPIFILRGQDRFAPMVIELWCHLAEQFDVTSRKVAQARNLAKTMEAWPVTKVPD